MTREYMDEKVRQIAQEIEDEQARQDKIDAVRQEITGQDITGGQATVYGEVIKFAPREFFDGGVQITVPEEWADMSPELAKLKYPHEGRPPIILTDTSTTVNLTVNHLRQVLTREELEPFIKAMKLFTGKSSKACFLEQGLVKDGAGEPYIGWYDFTVPGFDELLYNLVFCTVLERRALIFTFNCLDKHKDRWKSIALGMMRMLKIKGPDGKWREACI